MAQDENPKIFVVYIIILEVKVIIYLLQVI